MSKSFLTRDKFRRPEQFLSELLKKDAQGLFRETDEYSQFLYRAIVVAVDVEGAKLENPNGSGQVSHVVDGKSYSVKANVGPENPRGSVKARITTDGIDQFVSDDRIRVFWPFFPEHISVPIKPGEYVYVVFEDSNMEHGLWVTKIPGHENMNYYKGSSAFAPSNAGSLAAKFPDTSASSNSASQTLDTDKDASESKAGNDLSKLLT